MTERLTEIKYNGIVSKKREETGISCSQYCTSCSQGGGNCEYVCEMIKKLEEYETAEEEGRLVVLPYKVGTVLLLPRHGEVLPFKVVGTRIYINRTEIDLMYCGNNECYKFLSTHPTTEYVEREYFKTREEAKKALKEMEGK